jgi:ABC-type Zn2+ transport system substrate-binding protein/surface adhesin
VENTAAGTLKITLMIWLRFRSMKTVAMRLARKLPKAINGMENKIGQNLRNNEENETISEDHMGETAVSQ